VAGRELHDHEAGIDPDADPDHPVGSSEAFFPLHSLRLQRRRVPGTAYGFVVRLRPNKGVGSNAIS
jgi:hypothetical protein